MREKLQERELVLHKCMKEKHDCLHNAAKSWAGKKVGNSGNQVGNKADSLPPSQRQKEERFERCVRCRNCVPGSKSDGGLQLVSVHDTLTCM